MTKLDPTQIKKDFPYFENAAASVYLDNAAMSQVPQVVLDVVRMYEIDRANVHRGLYAEAIAADDMYEHARMVVGQFIGADPREVIFTAGATASSNMLVYMLEHFFTKQNNHDTTVQGRTLDWEIVTTTVEHHAGLIPLQQLAKRIGATLRAIPMKGVGLDYEEADRMITEKTKIVSVMLASNVTGAVHEVSRIAKRAHEVGAFVIVDATAAVGHIPVDVKALGADFLYFSGHKMCGPTGVGALWGRMELLEKLEPSFYGGGIVDEVTLEKTTWRGVPERFEAGTPNVAGAIGLGTAAEYLSGIGLERIHAYNVELVREAITRLERVPGVRVFVPQDVDNNVGIVSFVVDGIHPHDVAEILGGSGVAVRAGRHCAIPFHTALNVSASVRTSFYLYNTEGDIDALVAGIEKAKEVFKV